MSEKRDPIFFVLEPSTGYTKYQHRSALEAQLEAKRLARENPGREFLVLEARLGFRSLAMESFLFASSDDDIPF